MAQGQSRKIEGVKGSCQRIGVAFHFRRPILKSSSTWPRHLSVTESCFVLPPVDPVRSMSKSDPAPIRTIPRHPFRPDCPQCGMHMIAISAMVDDVRMFECMRCHHEEMFRV